MEREERGGEREDGRGKRRERKVGGEERGKREEGRGEREER